MHLLAASFFNGVITLRHRVSILRQKYLAILNRHKVKTSALVITIGFILSSSFSYSQIDTSDMKVSQKVTASSKGYYSIGNNDEKLAQKAAVVSLGNKPARKGYYSIGKHSRKLPSPSNTQNIRNRQKVTKGYYSIRKNADKL